MSQIPEDTNTAGRLCDYKLNNLPMPCVPALLWQGRLSSVESHRLQSSTLITRPPTPTNTHTQTHTHPQSFRGHYINVHSFPGGILNPNLNQYLPNPKPSFLPVYVMKICYGDCFVPKRKARSPYLTTEVYLRIQIGTIYVVGTYCRLQYVPTTWIIHAHTHTHTDSLTKTKYRFFSLWE